MKPNARGDYRVELITLRQAAKQAERSYSWALDCLLDGRLEQGPQHVRPIMVTQASVDRQIRSIHCERLAKGARPARKQRPHLRLVVNNDA